ncbi:hypothetical protein KUTeg_013398 [Tegillarca granosa]|uniref:EF-hand domain-containing protein n=1 Tax=Tegillarca granosa TaxID=220873 RepID=A0ABQ9ETK7_TEGGR|nr:hypothetical protein KUTeg_013398 [Tegillarca granosa]
MSCEKSTVFRKIFFLAFKNKAYMSLQPNEKEEVSLFVVAVKYQGCLLSIKEYRATFKLFDLNGDGDGVIDIAELTEFVSKRESEDLEKALRDAFKMFDKDGNGVLCAKELRNALKKLGDKFSEKEIQEMIEEADTDRDGNINYEEI